MKNAKNVNFLQIDHAIKNISDEKGTMILPSREAWKKFNWTRKYFSEKPREGYFVWIKEQVDSPLVVCVSILSKKIQQELQNLLVIEKNLKITFQGTCNSLKKNLCGVHKAYGKIILKEGSVLNCRYIHSWDKQDIVESDYEFILEKNSRLDYAYKNIFSPKQLKMKTLLNLSEGASCDTKVAANCSQTEIKIEDTLILKEKGASGISRLRLVGGKNSDISAHSKVLGLAQSKGHLDCQGLIMDKSSKISLIPQLVCQTKEAQVTHEASIGKISEEELNYLRTRGLTQDEATKLILTGFLESV